MENLVQKNPAIVLLSQIQLELIMVYTAISE